MPSCIFLETFLLLLHGVEGERVCQIQSFTDQACSNPESPQLFEFKIGVCINDGEPNLYIRFEETDDGFVLPSYFDNACSQPTGEPPDRWVNLFDNCYSACYLDGLYPDCAFETLDCIASSPPMNSSPPSLQPPPVLMMVSAQE